MMQLNSLNWKVISIIFSFFGYFEPAPTDSIVLGPYMEGEITNAEKSSRSQRVRLDIRNILRTKITILNVAFFIFKVYLIFYI